MFLFLIVDDEWTSLESGSTGWSFFWFACKLFFCSTIDSSFGHPSFSCTSFLFAWCSRERPSSMEKLRLPIIVLHEQCSTTNTKRRSAKGDRQWRSLVDSVLQSYSCASSTEHLGPSKSTSNWSVEIRGAHEGTSSSPVWKSSMSIEGGQFFVI